MMGNSERTRLASLVFGLTQKVQNGDSHRLNCQAIPTCLH